MIIFRIIGWIIVIWLAGSLLYSIRFHLRNYLIQRQRINSGEVGEFYKEAHRNMNWKSLIYIQLFKFLVIIILLILLTKSTNSERQIDINNIEQVWTEKGKQEFLKSCIDSKPIKGLTSDENEEYCKCVLEKTIIEYPNPNEIGDYLPDEFVIKAGKECLEELKIMKQNCHQQHLYPMGGEMSFRK